MSDQDEFLSGGTPGAFTKKTLGGRNAIVGDHVRLVVTEEPTQVDQTDRATGAVKTYDDGKPRRQLRVVGQIDGTFEPVDDGDDGRRALYIKGGLEGGTRKDVMSALKAAGASRIDVGGVLDVTVDRLIHNPKGDEPAKGWKVVYEKPSQFEREHVAAPVERYEPNTPLPSAAPPRAVPESEPLTADEKVALVDRFPAHAASLFTNPGKARALLSS